MKDRYWLHALLFLLTFLSTMAAGTAWAGADPTEITNWGRGLTYALLILTFLTAHEFGHYIAARIHGVDATLPFYIPMPLILFGTMGAVIKTRSPIPNRRVLFDIGVAGPIAGFVVCLIILGVGYITLPPFEYIYSIHPDYAATGRIPETGMYFGDMILFRLMAMLFGGNGFVPPMNEVYHYPFLCVGWFGLFVTALNLAPFGNLDGGHVLYAMKGRFQHRVGRALWWVLLVLGLLSLVGALDAFLAAPSPDTWVIWLQLNISPVISPLVRTAPLLFQVGEGWLLWALLIRFFIGVAHPEIADPEPLDRKRMIIGWLAMTILVLCMPLRIIYFVE
jgi:membrane-associated protease RseP (regulator of RpoE activity)